MQNKRIVVVGAGPAGMMAAIRSGELTRGVTLIEKNSSAGKKLLLSGKGRCNLTNACDLDSFLAHFSKNGEFLRDAFRKLFNRELIGFFEKAGLKLKTERQLRVFPASDRSDSILRVLKEALRRSRVVTRYGSALKELLIREKRIIGLLLASGETVAADRVILATGGVSYSFTGSTGEGINIVARLGHKITALKAGLVPLETRQRVPRLLQGLALRNIRLKFGCGRNEIITDIGELLFTGFGISGPLVLTVSGRIADWLKVKGSSVYLEIDLKPGLSREQLEMRILREFRAEPRKNIKNILNNLLPKRLSAVLLDLAGITAQKKAAAVTQEERRRLLDLLKRFRLNILGTRPIEEAMVTRGGISLKDINPRSMESRLVKGLYFAGEMIDLDADTGGFNLQAAFSTGYLAGESAALN
ncbi:NAD(P)/FAD-dependent oxidoreductase [Candidatus Omnitrophota bacterium]